MLPADIAAAILFFASPGALGQEHRQHPQRRRRRRARVSALTSARAHRPVHHLHRRRRLAGGGQGDRRGARASRPRGRLPGGADLLRADAPQQRLPRGGRRGSRERFVRVFDGYDTIVSPSSSCVGTMRELRPELHGRLFELSELLVDRLGVTDVGAHFPHRVAYHPTCHSLRVTARRRRPAAPARRGRRARAASSCREARRVLRLRRHLRGQERRHLGGDGAPTSARRSSRAGPSVVHGARQLVPAADRRPPLARGRGRAHDAPRRDPRRTRAGRDERRAARRFPTAAHEALADAQLRANLRRATDTIRDKRAASSPSSPTGRSCATRAARSRRDVLAHLDELPAQFEAGGDRGRRSGALGARRGRGQRASCSTSRAPTASREVVKVKSLTTDEIGLNAALGGRRRAARSRPTSPS